LYYDPLLVLKSQPHEHFWVRYGLQATLTQKLMG